MADADIAPATVMFPSRRSIRWARAIVDNGVLYVARDPRDPTVQAFAVTDGPRRVGRATMVTSAEGDFRITTCGCAKGRWGQWSQQQLIGLANGNGDG